MNEYLRRARAALLRFVAAVDELDAGTAGTVAASSLQASTLAALADIVRRLRRANTQLQHSIDQMVGTGLDIVDLQVRLEGEGAGVASALKALGELLRDTPQVEAALDGPLHALDEAAERVAAALFPNAIEGVRDINRTLWLFRPLWLEYGRVLGTEVRRTGIRALTTDERAAVERTAQAVSDGFDAVNALLNALVVSGPADSTAVRALIASVRQQLATVVDAATSRDTDRFKSFRSVLRRAAALARDVDGQFTGLRVPVFPPLSALADLPLLAGPVYDDLAGVERFALFNITARLRSIPCSAAAGDHLLAARFGIRVFEVFPDRIYFTADRGFIDAVTALASARIFESAPAALHNFKAGSFKQRQFRRGNLQISYAPGSPDDVTDASKVRVDADIDLYRSPLRHLFGEVLVNHLTGSKTDQFKVWDTLASASVPPLGGFSVITV